MNLDELIPVRIEELTQRRVMLGLTFEEQAVLNELVELLRKSGSNETKRRHKSPKREAE